MNKEYNNQNIEYINQSNLNEGWKITNKYSQILLNNIEKENLTDIIDNIYSTFQTELKSKNLRNDMKVKYMRCWQTLINTNNNYKSHQIICNAVRQLHYTSYIHL